MNKRDLKVTCKGWFTRIVKRHLGPYRKTRQWLEKTQWLSSEELETIQLKLLRRMVKHAYETTPYYTELMDSLGIKPSAIKSLDDIQKFPVMNKQDMKAAGDKLLSRKFSRRFLNTAHTGGTSGLPVPVRRDIQSIGNEHAFVRRQFDWAGYEIHMRCGYLEGRRVTTFDDNDRRLYVYDAGMKELTLSTFHLTADIVPYYCDVMKKHDTQILIGYPSAVFVMAKVCLERQIQLPLKSVLTTSETLELSQKQIIEKAFNCSVYDYYGSAERVCYIHTCEKGTYHIVPEYGLTELFPADEPHSGMHHIVATGFWNMTMPLIRYDIGDLVLKGNVACDCGRQFPTVEKIAGRDSNVIITPTGRVMGASAIECILAKALYGIYDMPVLAGRVVQESNDLIVLEYVPTEKFSAEDKNTMLKILRKEVPPEIRVDVRSSRQINRTHNGKFVSFVMAEHH